MNKYASGLNNDNYRHYKNYIFNHKEGLYYFLFGNKADLLPLSTNYSRHYLSDNEYEIEKKLYDCHMSEMEIVLLKRLELYLESLSIEEREKLGDTFFIDSLTYNLDDKFKNPSYIQFELEPIYKNNRQKGKIVDWVIKK